MVVAFSLSYSLNAIMSRFLGFGIGLLVGKKSRISFATSVIFLLLLSTAVVILLTHSLTFHIGLEKKKVFDRASKCVLS